MKIVRAALLVALARLQVALARSVYTNSLYVIPKLSIQFSQLHDNETDFSIFLYKSVR
jgi:hypothetical protein